MTFEETEPTIHATDAYPTTQPTTTQTTTTQPMIHHETSMANDNPITDEMTHQETTANYPPTETGMAVEPSLTESVLHYKNSLIIEQSTVEPMISYQPTTEQLSPGMMNQET